MTWVVVILFIAACGALGAWFSDDLAYYRSHQAGDSPDNYDDYRFWYRLIGLIVALGGAPTPG